MDVSYLYEGDKRRAEQRLSFPRTGLDDREGNSSTVPSTIFPVQLETATALLAFFLSQNDIYEALNPVLGGFTEAKIGSLSVKTTESMQATRKFIPDYVKVHIDSFIIDRRIARRVTSNRIVI